MSNEQTNNVPVAPEAPAAPKASKKAKKQVVKKEAKGTKKAQVANELKKAATRIDVSKVVTVLSPYNKENPKRKGSKSAKRFALYNRGKKGMTVEAALKAGVRLDDIRWDLRHEFIALN